MNVGGGTGLLVRDIVKKYPHVHGTVFHFSHSIADAPGMEGFAPLYRLAKKHVHHLHFEILLGV